MSTTPAAPTPQAPGAPQPVSPPVPATPPVPTPPAAAKTPPWGDDANFTPAKAWELIENLRKEKGGDTDALKAQVTAMQEAQKAQQERIAAALGLSEPPKSEEALAETVKGIQEQLAASQHEATKLRIAAEKNIPAQYHDLLTETDPEKLSAQAEKVGALVAANAATAGTPTFQPNPGQGQGGQEPKSQADQDYEALFGPQS